MEIERVEESVSGEVVAGSGVDRVDPEDVALRTLTSEGPPILQGILDVVRLRADHGRWPARTEGTVIETYPHGLIVEITDGRGHTLETLSLRYEDVDVVWRAPVAAAGWRDARL